MKNKFLIFLILVATVSGILWGFAYERDPRPEFSGSGEALGYDQAAVTILRTGSISKALSSANKDRPLYPVFLAGIYKMFGHHYHMVTIVQIMLFIALCVLVYRLCQLLFSEKLARVACLATALCFSIASFSGWLYREVLFTFFIFILIYCLYKAQITFKNIWFIMAGIFFGLALLTNSIIQCFFIFMIINFLVVCRGYKLKGIYPKMCLFFIAASLIIGPCLLGGYVSFGSGGVGPLLMRERLEKMENLEGKYWRHFIGNVLGDFFAYKWFSDYDPREVRHGVKTWELYGQWVEQSKDLNVLQQKFSQEAKEGISKHPIMFLKQSSIDFLKFNTPLTPNVRMQHMFVGTHQNLSDFTKGSIILFIRLVYLIFFMLIIYGIVVSIKYWSKVGWVILIILYFNAVFSVTTGNARYSVPIYPFYIILASVGLLAIWFKHNEDLLFN